MKISVIITPIVLAAVFSSCTQPDMPVSYVKPVAKTETAAAPEPQPAADFSYNYVEEEQYKKPEIWEVMCDFGDDYVFPNTIADERKDKILTEYVIPEEEYKGTGIAQVDFYDYVNSQNTTTFKINPVFGGSIIGKQGTTIHIPQEAFETMDSLDVEGPVTVSISEFFSKSDFIMAGLSSVCGDKMIESSGMFNIKATTADGKEVRLKPGKKIKLELPDNKKPLKGTKVFYGNNNHATTTAPQNWVFPNLQGTSNKPEDTKAWRKLENKILYNIVFNNVKLNDSIRAPRRYSALHVMNPNYKVKTEKSFVRYLAMRHSYDKYFQKFFVKKDLYPAVQSMDELDSLKLTFTIDTKGRLRRTVAKSKTMSAEGVASIENAFNMGKKRFNMNVLHKSYGDYVMYLVKRTPPNFNFGADGLFDIGQLGWINCDRFLSEGQPLIAMEINEKENPDTRYFCVFNKLNSIMPAYIGSGGNYMFPNIPANMDAIIVGIRNGKTDKPEVLIAETKTTPEFKTAPFTAVTPAEMKVKLSIAFGETPAPATVTMVNP